MNLIQSSCKSLSIFVSSLNMTNCEIKSMSDFSIFPAYMQNIHHFFDGEYTSYTPWILFCKSTEIQKIIMYQIL
jgi:hypothetical protein